MFYHSVIMSSFVPEKEHFRHVFFLFHRNKKIDGSHRLVVETYDEHTPSIQTCEASFRKFKSGDFNVKDLLNEDPTQT